MVSLSFIQEAIIVYSRSKRTKGRFNCSCSSFSLNSSSNNNGLMMTKTMKDNNEEERYICGITNIDLKSVILGIFVSIFF